MHQSIILMGMPGCGKSYWMQALAEHWSLETIDLDLWIERNENMPIANIFKKYGEEQFRLMEHNALLVFQNKNAPWIMAAGGGTPCFFNNLEIMKELALTVYLETSLKELFSRLKNKNNRPLLEKLNDAQLKSTLQQLIKKREKFYQKASLTINTQNLTLDGLVQQIELHKKKQAPNK